MKRVFVLSASYGEGHNAAARGLVEAINNQAGGEAAQLLDLLALSIPRRDPWAQRADAIAINRLSPDVERALLLAGSRSTFSPPSLGVSKAGRIVGATYYG